jgi:hypothetical protein
VSSIDSPENDDALTIQTEGCEAAPFGTLGQAVLHSWHVKATIMQRRRKPTQRLSGRKDAAHACIGKLGQALAGQSS